MGPKTTYSVLAFHLLVTLCTCPLISGLDRTISEEDLRRSLERLKSEAPRQKEARMEGYGELALIIVCAHGGHCTDTTPQLIIREVLIRNQFKTIDQPCNTYNDEKLLLEPPVRSDITFFKKPFETIDFPDNTKYYANYLIWQEKILDSGKTFCDPFKNLFCSSENKCACQPGSKWKIQALQLLAPGSFTMETTFRKDTCIIPSGGACKKDDKMAESTRFYYDPLQDTGNTILPEPVSLPKLSCETLEYNLQDRCSSNHDDYFMGSICLNEEIEKKLPILEKYFKETAKVLGVGDTCDFDGHNQLYKSQDLDAEKFNARLKSLESLQVSGIGFCDLQKFLTCGKSGKCECLEPTVLEGAECTLPGSHRTCGDNSAVKRMIMTNGFVPEAQRRLAKGIENLNVMEGCGAKSRCYMDIQNANGPNDLDMFCTCRGFFTGPNCDEPLTLFLAITRPSLLPSDAKDTTEKIRIFIEFNKQAVKFQEKLKLKSGEKCDFYKELEIRRLIRRIDSLNERKTVMTKSDYQNLMTAISKFTETNEQYCLRTFDPQRGQDFLIDHSPYNQPIECLFSSRVCQTPLAAMADRSEGQIASSHRRILETFFSTLECGKSCTKNIESGETPVLDTRSNVDRLEDFLYNKTTFCVRPKEVGVKVKCEPDNTGANGKCVCHGTNGTQDGSCSRICPNVTNSNNSTNQNHGISHLAINNGGGCLILLLSFLIVSI